MKKITLLAIFMVSFLTNAQVVLNEDFEGSPLTLPTTWGNENLEPLGDAAELWTLGATGDFDFLFSAGNGYFYTEGASGNYAIFDSDAYGSNGSENVALTSPIFDCSSLTVIKLTYVHFAAILDPSGYGSNAYVEVYNGTDWVLVAEYSSTTVAPFSSNYTYDYGEELIDVSTELAGVSNAQVRFRSVGDWGYGWQIDNIVVQQPQGSAPDQCANMAPVDAATDVEITTENGYKVVTFFWDAVATGDPATSYNWVFGETAEDVSNNVSNADGTAEAGVGITWGTTVESGWQPNTTYYWKVQSVNVSGSTDSPVFSFTTAAVDPLLGVEDFTFDALSVSPNPVKDVITINSPVGFDSVEVFNQLGQLVLKSNADLMNNNKLDLSALNPGMYMLQIKADNKSKTVKIIKE
ncbi:MAG: T9SS type A sorting domain-containing protein [Flavobacteriaceae bacterium]|nr:T9SS type A sorting domain-containing protein [Flavobacteriaceae bacterium]